MAPPRPKKKKADKNKANLFLVKQNVRTLVDVLGQQRVLDNLARALARIFKGDPPAGSVAVTFGSGTTITVVVGVEPDQPNRKDHTVSVEQLPGTAETDIASSAEQPLEDRLGSDFTSYVRARGLKVRYYYTDENDVEHPFVAIFPATPPVGIMEIPLNAV